MGNSLGGKKTTKVMKIDGESFKLRTPVRVCEVLKDHPGFVLLDSEEVKHYGIRAKALEASKELAPKRLYFLVELPRAKGAMARRVHSGINMSAKERLESLVLSRRSASDLIIMKPHQDMVIQGKGVQVEEGSETKGVRLKMRLPKAEVERLIQGCKTEAEAAQKIMELYKANGYGNGGSDVKPELHWSCGRGRDNSAQSSKAREKRVSFMAISEGGSAIAVAS